MPSNHLILCHPLLLLPSIFPSIRVFSNESALPIRWPKYWSFSFNIIGQYLYPRRAFWNSGSLGNYSQSIPNTFENQVNKYVGELLHAPLALTSKVMMLITGLTATTAWSLKTFNTVSLKFSQMFENAELIVLHYLLASSRTMLHGLQFGKSLLQVQHHQSHALVPWERLLHSALCWAVLSGSVVSDSLWPHKL